MEGRPMKLPPGEPMDAQAMRDALQAINMNQGGCARFAGLDERTVRRWVSEQDNVDIPLPVQMLLRLMVVLDLKPNQVRRLVGQPALTADELSRPVGRPRPGGSDRAEAAIQRELTKGKP